MTRSHGQASRVPASRAVGEAAGDEWHSAGLINTRGLDTSQTLQPQQELLQLTLAVLAQRAWVGRGGNGAFFFLQGFRNLGMSEMLEELRCGLHHVMPGTDSDIQQAQRQTRRTRVLPSSHCRTLLGAQRAHRQTRCTRPHISIQDTEK